MRWPTSPTITWHEGSDHLAALQRIGTDALVVLLIQQGPDGPQMPTDLSQVYGTDLAALARRSDAGTSAGSVTKVTLPEVSGAPWTQLPDRLIFAGIGDGGAVAFRRAGAAIARAGSGAKGSGGKDGALGESSAKHVIIAGGPADADNASARDAWGALIEGLDLGTYSPPFTGTGPGPNAPFTQVTVLADAPDRTVIDAAHIGAGATILARTLAATPSNIKNPAWFAEQATQAANGITGVKVVTRDESWLAEHDLGGILAVGSGSATPPRLVTATYTPKGARGQDPIVLVGKGITYDTGGISIKPRESMVPMKTDMSGAAVVLAAVLGAAQAKVNQPIVAVMPLAENAFGADSYKPGDVLRMGDGTSVEIRNTDAEGRLVLADAIAWARQEYQPSAVIDVATLTGAATLGLGKRHAALFATDAAIADALRRSGDEVGEPMWPMPLVEDYRHALDSDIADLCHINTDPHTSGGAITAALFLSHFTKGVPWAHLDIAGPGRAPKTEHEIHEGPTGFTARALVRWLTSSSN